jgi:hypothetical protein
MFKVFRLVFLLVFFFSCKKDRNCVCSYTGDTGVTITKDYLITHVTKKQAEEVCEGNEITVGTFIWTCELE